MNRNLQDFFFFYMYWDELTFWNADFVWFELDEKLKKNYAMIEFRTRNLDFAREFLTDTLLLESFPLPITASSSLAKVSLIALFFSLI